MILVASIVGSYDGGKEEECSREEIDRSATDCQRDRDEDEVSEAHTECGDGNKVDDILITLPSFNVVHQEERDQGSGARNHLETGARENTENNSEDPFPPCWHVQWICWAL